MLKKKNMATDSYVNCKSNGKSGSEKVDKEKTTRGSDTPEKQAFFSLAKFDSEGISYEERLPKTFNDLESLLNKILINLEETEYVFRNQAREILDRDLTLNNWRIKLKNLKDCVEERRKNHERIDESMQFVSKLGVQINNTVTGIEKELANFPHLANGRRYTPERMSMYEAMMNLNLGQREMLQQVSNTVLSFNDLIDSNPTDPIEQFTRILSLHMETLKMIERKTIEMEEELRTVKSLREFYTNLKSPIVYECYY